VILRRRPAAALIHCALTPIRDSLGTFIRHQVDRPETLSGRVVVSAPGILVLVVVLVAALSAAGIFVWPMLSALAGPDGGLMPAIVMIVGCFVIGGVLMFLIFYSARKGHDERVYRGNQPRRSKKG
jgi:hypothetical protein